MIITRKSMFTGDTHHADIAVSEQQFAQWQSGVVIQEAMPDLSRAEREFLKTGTTPDEWIAHLGADPKQIDTNLKLVSHERAMDVPDL